jgi:hypothetical protein
LLRFEISNEETPQKNYITETISWLLENGLEKKTLSWLEESMNIFFDQNFMNILESKKEEAPIIIEYKLREICKTQFVNKLGSILDLAFFLNYERVKISPGSVLDYFSVLSAISFGYYYKGLNHLSPNSSSTINLIYHLSVLLMIELFDTLE